MSATPKIKLEFVDALRGLAAGWVLLYHLWNRYYPAQNTQGQPFESGSAGGWCFWLTFCSVQFGYTGIQLFFVVSGFCIHYRQARDRRSAVELGGYLSRRMRRIYPAYFASLILTSVVLLIPKVMVSVARHQPINWVEAGRLGDLVISAVFAQPLFPNALDFNGVYWTLVYEVQFYLVYPFALLVARRTGWGPLLVVFGAAEAAHLGWGWSLGAPCLFVYRFFEWLLGVVAAELFVRPVPPWGQTLLLVGCGALGAGGIAAVFFPLLFPWRDMLLAIGYSGVLLACGWRALGAQGRPSEWASTVLARVGVFSYSLYLVHVPVIDFVWWTVSSLVRSGWASPSTGAAAALLAVPIALGTGYIFYRLFERPVLKERGST